MSHITLFLLTDRRQAASNSDERMGDVTAEASRFGNRKSEEMTPISPLNFSEKEEIVANAAWDKGITVNQTKNLKVFFQKYASYRSMVAFYENRFAPEELQVKPLQAPQIGGRGGRGGPNGRGGRGGRQGGRGGRGGHAFNGPLKGLMD